MASAPLPRGTVYARTMQQARAFFLSGRRYAEENGVGIAVSVALHALLFCAVLFTLMHRSGEKTSNLIPVIPVDLIRLGEETRSPAAERKAVVPQQKSGHPQEAASPARAASATGSKPAPVDTLEARLKALARLKQPDTPLKLPVGQGVSDVDAANGEPGDSATYSIRDYVLAQVLRRWTLNLSLTARRPLIVPIRVTMKRDGTIASAVIVEEARSKADAVYRDVAIGARNAVLLSSPISLPAGDYPKEMHFTLRLDTRAVLR